VNTSSPIDLRQAALDCVSDMGDVFWDYDAVRDAARQYRDPSEVAADAIEKTLREVVLDASVSAGALLRAEYETLLSELSDEPPDDQIVGTLVTNAEWTERGAREVLVFSRQYGRSILRNALALAEAMEIEDGDAGF
jgi:hypothetical protein